MSVFDTSPSVALARLDEHGRLVAADARLEQLNAQAGGAIGAPLALPAVATVARLARRLGIVVARPAIVADGDDDLDLWVRATPDDEATLLQVSGWQMREPQPPSTGAAATAAFDEADADFRWESDAAMCLTALSGDDATFDADALLGKPITRFLVLDDESDSTVSILAAAAASTGFVDQLATIRATGRRVRLSASARLDPAGRFAGFVGAGRFVTPTADAEPAIDDGAPAFPDTFSERLERALRMPLTRIVAHADSIGAQADGPVKPEYVEYAQDIASAARHLMGLVDDLVDLQAIERADFRVEVEPIDLADVARRAGGLLSVRAANADVRIDRPDFADTLAARGEFRRALQVLVNLVGNAVRYSPPGGTVSIALEQVGSQARVTVADQGKGIANGDHHRIFEKFGRVDPNEPGGTGLGLYIARRLARAMGGELSVESTPGQGARFTLALPAGD
ncbi:HAMP domain-containing histidine kinase [Sphingomonas sp. S1-29]|uniref:sensor histidine kinase n=1 Tax=Sphingomonas sp. S1-29 TaxID=2991074 RepID=UPI0022400CA8|nr:HAMP domain-containing sensor histidine kinase [Sphingomonas sp. S1-29]UZK69871.1 HAMP domain-containing histidine kinase [Sphingomonas sp. S1-29]